MPQWQVVSRFRSNDPALKTVLYQIGPGIFSANAVPPYRSWEDFAPKVESGLETLLQTRIASEKTLPFTQVSLRYIDAFRPDLKHGLDTSSFLSEMGFKLEYPEIITRHIAPGSLPQPFIITRVPVPDGSLQISLGDAVLSGERTIVMDTTLSSIHPIDPSKEAVMTTLNRAHDTIHSIFLEMTRPIHHLMQPEQ